MNRPILDPAEVLLLDNLVATHPIRSDFELRLLALLQRIGFIDDHFRGLTQDQLRCVRQAAALAQSRSPRVAEALRDIEPMQRAHPKLQPQLLTLIGRDPDSQAPIPKNVVAAVNMLHQAFTWRLPYHSPDSESAGHLSARVVERQFQVVPQPDGLYSVLTAVRGKGLVTIAADLPDQNTAVGLAARLQGANRLAVTLKKSEGAFRCQVRALCGPAFRIPLAIGPTPTPVRRPEPPRDDRQRPTPALAIAA